MGSKPYKLLLILILTTLLGACRANPVEQSPRLPTQQIMTFTPSTPRFDYTFTPEAITPTPTDEPGFTPTPVQTATQTPSPTATSDPALVEVKLLGLSWQPGYNLLLSINFAAPVDPKAYRVVIEGKEVYQCQVLPQYPDRLYCIGRGRNVYDRITVTIFPVGQDAPVFEDRIYVPYFTE